MLGPQLLFFFERGYLTQRMTTPSFARFDCFILSFLSLSLLWMLSSSSTLSVVSFFLIPRFLLPSQAFVAFPKNSEETEIESVANQITVPSFILQLRATSSFTPAKQA